MKTGIVKYFNQASGYGFIQEDETQILVYVQSKDIAEKLCKDDEVIFEVESDKIQSAVKVKKLY